MKKFKVGDIVKTDQSYIHIIYGTLHNEDIGLILDQHSFNNWFRISSDKRFLELTEKSWIFDWFLKMRDN